MKLHVCGKIELQHIDLDDFTHMISIQDGTQAPVQLRPLHIPQERYLYLEFSDVVDSGDTDAPSRNELIRLADWIRTQEVVDSLLVHCDAGIGRSPAVALFCTAHFSSISYEESMNRVHASASMPYIWPNSLVVELADEILGADGAAIQAVTKWKQGRTAPF